MIDKLKEVRTVLGDHFHRISMGLPHNVDSIDAHGKALTTLDRIINQDEVDMVEKAARAMSCSYRCSDDAKAALRAIGLIGGE